jgi:hypothetical protein
MIGEIIAGTDPHGGRRVRGEIETGKTTGTGSVEIGTETGTGIAMQTEYGPDLDLILQVSTLQNFSSRDVDALASSNMSFRQRFLSITKGSSDLIGITHLRRKCHKAQFLLETLHYTRSETIEAWASIDLYIISADAYTVEKKYISAEGDDDLVIFLLKLCCQ